MNSIFISISIGLPIIIAIALITIKKSSNYKANIFLAFAYVCLAFVLIYSLVDEIATIPRLLVHSDLIFFYLTYPFMYIYVAFTTGTMSGFRLKNAIHLLPVILGLGNYIYYQFHNTVNEGDFQTILPHSLVAIIIHMMGLVILMIYLVQSFRLIYAYNQHVKGSHTERQQISWLKTLFPLFMVPCFIQFVSVAGVNLPEEARLIKNLVLFLMLTFLFLKQLQYWTLFIDNESKNIGEHIHKSEPTSPEKRERYEQQLKLIMIDNSAFRNPDLCNETVAKQMYLTPRQFSHVIKEITGKNFPRYVNTLRIDYAKTLLKDPLKAKWNSASIALECGFKTREHFSKVFKEIVEVSFEEYQHQRPEKYAKLNN